ncbi:putative importin subunit beta-4 [Smittium mucronatum]|uniref:Putative importin subunit beta-4 n=1 Tax=Smittium mucronatum TaxID=133383 RepID=A0A1R0H494_9FUNG|nr:putative importin subunit beta-4 [Smittium mucronatum]
MDQTFISNLQTQLHQLVFASDTETIQLITSDLSEKYYSNPLCVPALVEISTTAPEWQVRQLAAVELRKRIPKFWSQLDPAVRVSIKDHLLKQILVEQDVLTRHGLARVISSIAKIDIPNNEWPVLVDFLYSCCSRPDASHREIGVYVLDSLLEFVSDSIADQFDTLLTLFSNLIKDPESIQVRVTTMQALGKIGECIEPGDKADVARFQELVPSMAQVLNDCLTAGDEDNAGICFEVFNILLLLEAPLLNKHMADLIEFSLVVGSNKDLDDNLRIMALNFLVWTSTYKRTRLQKLKIVSNLIERLMLISTEEDSDDIDEDSPSRVALRVLNVLSTNLPPAQVFPIVVNNVVLFMQNSDPMVRKGGMLSLAITIEGSVDFARNQVSDLVQIICLALQDSDKRVQRAACMALGCFADELSDEISQFHSQLLPRVLEILATNNNVEMGKHACNALDAILEGLGKNVIGYLPQLMQQLINQLDNGSILVKPMALAAIGSAAHAAGPEFAPYYKDVMIRIGQAMSLTDSEENISLRGVATDTAGTLAESMGATEFRPYLEDTMKLAFDGMHMNASTLRDCGFCFFGVLSRVFGSDFSSYIPHIVPEILTTFRLDETVTNIEHSDNIDDEDESDFNVNTAVSDEKEIAADCAGELFTNSRAGFLPYVSEVSTELVGLLSNYSDNVRKSAVSALFAFVTTFSSMSASEPWVPGLSIKFPVHENVASIIKLVMPAIIATWEDESEPMVVTRILVELRIAMSQVGPALIQSSLETLIDLLNQLLQKKALCQLPDVDDEDDLLDTDELAEYDSLLIGATGDCIAEVSHVLGSDFTNYLEIFYPLITSYYKPSCALAERSMSIGCLSETTKNMGAGISPFAERLYNLFSAGLNDPETEVRSNAAYGIGLLVFYVKIDWTQHMPTILTNLAALFSISSNVSNIVDNACGAVARLILGAPNNIPYNDVLPTWLANLPIKVDHQEDEPVYDALCFLIENNVALLQPHSQTLNNIIRASLEDPECLMSDHARSKLSGYIQ